MTPFLLALVLLVQGGNLSDGKIASGLSAALQQGAANAITLTGKPDGFFKNEAIKILMPERLRTMEKGLRAVGFGSRIDEFVLSMNRAAEQAAPKAKPIFIDAIRKMTFDDARQILAGGDTAATTFFKDKTSTSLAAAFLPIVSKTTSQTGVTKQYKDLIGRYESIPFVKKEAFDIDQYVVGKALDGLFFMVGEEEKKIRKNPAAQATSLLRQVFGRK